MDAKQTWLFAMALRMVRCQCKRTTVAINYTQFSHDIIFIVFWMTTVTGLHDMDEFVQSQLILAVSFHSFVYLHPSQHVLSLMVIQWDKVQF